MRIPLLLIICFTLTLFAFSNCTQSKNEEPGLRFNLFKFSSEPYILDCKTFEIQNYRLDSDDLGVSELKENERRDILEIVEDRYGIGSTIITSQLSIKDWHAYFGGGRPADSLCDRLVHNCHRIEIHPIDSQQKARHSVDLQNLT